MSIVLTYISAGAADLHAAPDPSSEVLTQAICGSSVNVLDKKKAWVLIGLEDHSEGWALAETLVSRSTPYLLNSFCAKVATMWTYAYRCPDTTPSPPLLALPYNTRIEILSDPAAISERWLNAMLPDGRSCYVQSADFLFSEDRIEKNDLLQEAEKFLGLPYRWGGTSGFGFDCSGFVQTLFSKTGFILPRNTSQQAADPRLERIQYNQIEAGDLVFFGKGQTIDHVGLCMNPHIFIHAVTTNETGPHTVQTSRLHTREWERKYRCARRVHLPANAQHAQSVSFCKS